jgi:arylsulfatase A-like enzyme
MPFSPANQVLCLFLLVGLTAVSPPSFCRAGDVPSSRPNIVVIVADDLGFSDVGCYGGEIRTPHLDRLAAGGVRYTQFYNAAKCHTTRASLMSGLYPHHTGCELPLAARASKDAARRVQHSGVSIASVLHDAGYATYASGKWHAGGRALQRGFDHFFGLPGGACSYFTPAKSLQRDDERATFPPDEEFYFTDASHGSGGRLS